MANSRFCDSYLPQRRKMIDTLDSNCKITLQNGTKAPSYCP
jgi:hypothetical protein